MIIVGPALPHEPKPLDPKDRFIDLVAMKRFEEYLATKDRLGRYAEYHSGKLTFWDQHDFAVAWIAAHDHDADSRHGDYWR